MEEGAADRNWDGSMEIEKTWLAVAPKLSWTVIVNVEVSTRDGLPPINPFVLISMPIGAEPDGYDQA